MKPRALSIEITKNRLLVLHNSDNWREHIARARNGKLFKLDFKLLRSIGIAVTSAGPGSLDRHVGRQGCV